MSPPPFPPHVDDQSVGGEQGDEPAELGHEGVGVGDVEGEDADVGEFPFGGLEVAGAKHGGHGRGLVLFADGFRLGGLLDRLLELERFAGVQHLLRLVDGVRLEVEAERGSPGDVRLGIGIDARARRRSPHEPVNRFSRTTPSSP